MHCAQGECSNCTTLITALSILFIRRLVKKKKLKIWCKCCLENRQSCTNVRTLSFYNKFGQRTVLCTTFLIALYWTCTRQHTLQQDEEAAVISYHGSNNQITNTAVLNKIWNFSVNEQTTNGFHYILITGGGRGNLYQRGGHRCMEQRSTQEHVARS